MKSLNYYAFDWDDNILFMQTTIIVIDDNGNEIEMSTSDYAHYRNIISKEPFLFKNHLIVDYPREKNGEIDYSSTFRNFRDFEDKDIFLKDTRKSLSMGKFGPSWNDFKESIINGSIFAIITARGHESDSIRKAVEYIINTQLSKSNKIEMYNNLLKFKYLFGDKVNYEINIDYIDFTENKIIKEYLDLCEFVGVSAPSRNVDNGAVNPEKEKMKVLLNFISRINEYSKSIGVKSNIGFSDDDNGTIKHMKDMINNLNKEKFPEIMKWVIKNTNNPLNIKVDKININKNEILKFNDFNERDN